MTPETYFLPAARAPREEVLRQHALLAGDPLVRDLIDSSMSLTAILNEQRQAVLLNEAFRDHLGLADADAALGARFGESVGCRRAGRAPSGCGTSEACRDCGVARATLSACKGRTAVKPCRVQTVVCGEDLSLMTRVSPFAYKDERFLLLSASDLEHELRRRELEQIFFHDVLNTASGVQGLLQLMQDAPEESGKCLPLARRASDTLIEELLSQRDLAAAESGELKLNLTGVRTGPFLDQVAGLFAKHPLAKDRRVIVESGSESLDLPTDATMLSRVMVNLIKNALEAAPPGSAVTVSCRGEEGLAVFRVHNPGGMPPEVRHQVFQRSFSTKGAGRGLGTYSIRLLTEKYLGGEASFDTDPARGTTFRVAYPLDRG